MCPWVVLDTAHPQPLGWNYTHTGTDYRSTLLSKDLAALYARRFIQRRDVKAVQLDRKLGHLEPGDWMPHRHKVGDDYEYFPFKMSDILSHLDGSATYGHYLLDSSSKCRMFAFDIDLEKTGSWVKVPDFSKLPEGMTPEQEEEWASLEMTVTDGVNPRELWADRRAGEARTWYKLQMKELAAKFLKVIQKELDLPCAAAYSGSKGVHVYGFTGEMPALECREAAMIVMDLLDEFELFRGKNFYRHKNADPIHGYPSFSVEVFPKQTEVEESGGFGNLMRLPMGVNQKNPKDPCFFLDMTGRLADFKPHANPVKLLETGDPFV